MIDSIVGHSKLIESRLTIKAQVITSVIGIRCACRALVCLHPKLMQDKHAQFFGVVRLKHDRLRL